MDNKLSMSDVDFHKLKLDGTLISNCELFYSCFSEVYRLYIKRDEHNGFKAIAIYNSFSENTKESWEINDNKPLLVDIIFYANACFDGIRVIKMNESIYHPSLERLGDLISSLRKAEKSICSHPD